MNPRVMTGLTMALAFLSACGTPVAQHTPTALISTSVPATFTPTPLPPTPTVTSAPALPILTDGTDSWRLMTITVSSTATIVGPTGSQTIDAGENRVFLRVELECATGKNLFDLIRSNPDFKRIYVTDTQGEKHIATQMGVTGPLDRCKTNWILFQAMSKDRQGFRLYFADLPPVDLGR